MVFRRRQVRNRKSLDGDDALHLLVAGFASILCCGSDISISFSLLNWTSSISCFPRLMLRCSIKHAWYLKVTFRPGASGSNYHDLLPRPNSRSPPGLQSTLTVRLVD
jgi:hypothetical protein